MKLCLDSGNTICATFLVLIRVLLSNGDRVLQWLFVIDFTMGNKREIYILEVTKCGRLLTQFTMQERV